MKKILLGVAFLCLATFSVNAQEISKNAIGLRLGDNSGLGAEVTFQHKLKEVNRLEVTLGTRSDSNLSSFKLTGLYQWVWDLDNNFHWYAGFGGGIGNWKNKVSNDSEAVLFGAGNIGIEYNFEIPLLISLDYRPEFGFSDIYDGLNSDFALSVRYQF
jgi:hypothetical protein